MVSLLPAGRALSIVTNTVVRTVAEERGAYSELFSTRPSQRGRLKKDSRIVTIYREEKRGQKIRRWRALGKSQRGERDGERNDNYDRVVVDKRGQTGATSISFLSFCEIRGISASDATTRRLSVDDCNTHDDRSGAGQKRVPRTSYGAARAV